MFAGAILGKPNDPASSRTTSSRAVVHVIRNAIAAIPKAKKSDTHEEKDDPSDAKDAAGRDAGEMAWLPSL